MRGRMIPVSPNRRMLIDFMWASKKVPMVAVQRLVRIPHLVAARAACATRPSWEAIFLKAYGIATGEFPELRRAYVKLPWPHFYEANAPVGAIAVARDYLGEPSLFGITLPEPGKLPLLEITQTIAHARHAPIEDIKIFRRLVRFIRLPWLLRRMLLWLALNIGRQRTRYLGTYGIITTAALGVESIHVLSVQPTTMAYGIIADDGSLQVRLFWDHRVVDAVIVASALTRFEQILNGAIADEISALPRR